MTHTHYSPKEFIIPWPEIEETVMNSRAEVKDVDMMYANTPTSQNDVTLRI